MSAEYMKRMKPSIAFMNARRAGIASPSVFTLSLAVAWAAAVAARLSMSCWSSATAASAVTFPVSASERESLAPARKALPDTRDELSRAGGPCAFA